MRLWRKLLRLSFLNIKKYKATYLGSLFSLSRSIEIYFLFLLNTNVINYSTTYSKYALG